MNTLIEQWHIGEKTWQKEDVSKKISKPSKSILYASNWLALKKLKN